MATAAARATTVAPNEARRPAELVTTEGDESEPDEVELPDFEPDDEEELEPELELELEPEDEPEEDEPEEEPDDEAPEAS